MNNNNNTMIDNNNMINENSGKEEINEKISKKKVKENKGKKEVKENKGGRFSGGAQPDRFSGAEGETCSVCCEFYSSAIRKKIECPRCEYNFCKKCLELYLLTSTANTANCMNCNLEFSSSFLFKNTSKIFASDRYIEKQAILVLNEQKSLLPETLVQYNNKKKIDKIRQEIKRELSQIKERSRILYDQLENLKFINTEGIVDDKVYDKSNRPCPVNDCKGYLSSAWKCGMCDIYVCSDCGNVKGKRTDEDHVCNEDDKKTILLLKNDTKPCPGCSKYIYKIEGCDQMFCVGCHTVFSWNSGKKLHGVTCHNPHYYEYQRSQNGGVAPRVAGDVIHNPCAENEALPNWRILQWKFSNLIKDKKVLEKLEQIHRSINHNDDYVIRNINYKLGELHKNKIYKSYREKYLEQSSGYKEENWLSNIKAEIKCIEKCKQVKMVYDLERIVLIDIFRKMNINFLEIEDTFMEEFESIRKYSNSQLMEINKNYGTKVYLYNENFILE